MKNILLLVHDDEGQEGRFQVALDVTRVLHGHLECLSVMALPMIVSDYYGSGAHAVVMAELRDQDIANRDRLEQRLGAEDVSWSMGEAYGTFVDALSKASDFADLIVVSSRVRDDERHSHSEKLPLKARRPVLAVPPGSRGLDANGVALVAWDGSGPCNEAVRAAIPLLRCAKEVVLLEFNQPEGAFAMTDMATYLSRHGIAAELVERSTDRALADSIMEHAAHRNATYIVMGAYSMPRPAEAVFGGVTRSMLLKSEVPLFLAH